MITIDAYALIVLHITKRHLIVHAAILKSKRRHVLHEMDEVTLEPASKLSFAGLYTQHCIHPRAACFTASLCGRGSEAPRGFGESSWSELQLPGLQRAERERER